MTGHACPRCGSEVPAGSGRGRPRVWCSTACRRAASIERQAAERDGGAVQPVVVPRPPTAREDATATAALLHDLTTRLEHGEELPRPVRLAADALATAVMRTAEDNPFGWRVVPPAVRRERAKARERMRKLRAQRAAQSPTPKPEPASPAPTPAPPASPVGPRRVDVDAVELFIDTAAARIRARQLDDDLAAVYRRLTAATGRMVEAVQEIRPATAQPPAAPPMNRAQRRQAHRGEGRTG